MLQGIGEDEAEALQDGFDDGTESRPEYLKLIFAAHKALWEAELSWETTVDRSLYRNELRVGTNSNIIKHRIANMEKGD